MTTVRCQGASLKHQTLDDTAAYLWTNQKGYAIRLCVWCCAAWREYALQEPDLLPTRISQL